MENGVEAVPVFHLCKANNQKQGKIAARLSMFCYSQIVEMALDQRVCGKPLVVESLPAYIARVYRPIT